MHDGEPAALVHVGACGTNKAPTKIHYFNIKRHMGIFIYMHALVCQHKTYTNVSNNKKNTSAKDNIARCDFKK